MDLEIWLTETNDEFKDSYMTCKPSTDFLITILS